MDDEDELPEEPAPKVRRPGELDVYGSPFEPDRQPDLDEYMINKTKEFGSPGSGLGPGTGYLLADGSTVQLGGSSRAQDHRHVVPSSDAMRRWGWPEDVVRQCDQGTNSPAMREMMRRSGSIRVMVSRSELFLDMMARPTGAQMRVIERFISDTPSLQNVILAGAGRRTHEVEPCEAMELLSSL